MNKQNYKAKTKRKVNRENAVFLYNEYELNYVFFTPPTPKFFWSAFMTLRISMIVHTCFMLIDKMLTYLYSFAKLHSLQSRDTEYTSCMRASMYRVIVTCG